MSSPVTFVIIGSGNVAWHLSMALKRAGYKPLQVFSKTPSHARQLAIKLKCSYTTTPRLINPYAHWYFFAVNDNAIRQLAALPVLRGRRMVHTAAGIPSDVFSEFTSSFGVLYPLQTFSKQRSINIRKIPLFIEGSDDQTSRELLSVAKKLSGQVSFSSFDERIALHVAAVFASNFVNHCLTRAYRILKQQQLPWNSIKPLVHETISKALSGNPLHYQTGPALRGDSQVIKRHLQFLKKDSDTTKMYRFVSDRIYRFYNQK